ncbi:sel1 repeat family protein [Spongiibacter taiwanensis]|uniref:tetratricopeptide repeat protein n=1 Tax=Spongiibacter taiwanensis TaxID=1748242 RepID=UPI002035689F|nr:tetratricopeptide repeat protein [Spongiibacter taiwanensis]USA42190.1 sel1 repeat family protein [Spongiibacter taiwanensis]
MPTRGHAQEPTPEQLRQAVQFHMEAAKQGDANAQLMVSQAYWNGWGVSQHHDIAIRWLKKSADQNYPPALTDYGHRLLTGTGVTTNINEGLALLDKASAAGFAHAKVVLGAYYLNLTLDHQVVDASKGEQYLREAVALGDSNAMMYLGVMYLLGVEPGANLNAPVQTDKALHWLTKSAEALNLNAMLTLGRFYQEPGFQQQNAERAYFWFYLVKQITGSVADGLVRAELSLSKAKRAKVLDEVEAWLKVRESLVQAGE